MPKSLRVIDVGVGNLPGVLAVIDEAEVVCARLALLQIGSEEIFLENVLRNGGIKKSCLSLWLDYVDIGKGRIVNGASTYRY